MMDKVNNSSSPELILSRNFHSKLSHESKLNNSSQKSLPISLLNINQEKSPSRFNIPSLPSLDKSITVTNFPSCIDQIKKSKDLESSTVLRQNSDETISTNLCYSSDDDQSILNVKTNDQYIENNLLSNQKDSNSLDLTSSSEISRSNINSIYSSCESFPIISNANNNISDNNENDIISETDHRNKELLPLFNDNETQSSSTENDNKIVSTNVTNTIEPFFYISCDHKDFNYLRSHINFAIFPQISAFIAPGRSQLINLPVNDDKKIADITKSSVSKNNTFKIEDLSRTFFPPPPTYPTRLVYDNDFNFNQSFPYFHKNYILNKSYPINTFLRPYDYFNDFTDNTGSQLSSSINHFIPSQSSVPNFFAPQCKTKLNYDCPETYDGIIRRNGIDTNGQYSIPAMAKIIEYKGTWRMILPECKTDSRSERSVYRRNSETKHRSLSGGLCLPVMHSFSKVKKNNELNLQETKKNFFNLAISKIFNIGKSNNRNSNKI